MDEAIIITSDLIFVEFFDSICNMGPFWRKIMIRAFNDLKASPNIQIQPFAREIFCSALDFYKMRLDKSYSFTDCVAIVMIKNAGINEVLTTDHHFEQEGFAALLR